MNDWLDAGKPLPQAILISNDPIAIGALKALYERKIRVPDDVAVISINGDSSGNYSSPTLTSVNVHAHEMGMESIVALTERINKSRKLPKKIEYIVALEQRQSVSLPDIQPIPVLADFPVCL
jgi:Transcriptional regulators